MTEEEHGYRDGLSLKHFSWFDCSGTTWPTGSCWALGQLECSAYTLYCVGVDFGAKALPADEKWRQGSDLLLLNGASNIFHLSQGQFSGLIHTTRLWQLDVLKTTRVRKKRKVGFFRDWRCTCKNLSTPCRQSVQHCVCQLGTYKNRCECRCPVVSVAGGTHTHKAIAALFPQSSPNLPHTSHTGLSVCTNAVSTLNPHY